MSTKFNSVYIHSQGILDLTAEPTHSSLGVALALTTLLDEQSRHNVVKVSSSRLSELAKQNPRTVSRHLKTLIKVGMVYKVHVNTYFINPRLAWFGTYDSWQAAIDKLASGKSVEELYKHLAREDV